MINHYIENNKLISMFDVVRFITSVEQDRFRLDLISNVDDYRIVLAHGVIGELINLIESNYYGLDKSKLIILCNNVETAKLCNSHGLNTYIISEYIFSNDDFYNISDVDKQYDCIFPGRISKAQGLFNREYNVNLFKCYTHKDFPLSRNDMPHYYNMSKCGLMTTESEGSCLSVSEMLMCGIPVISVKINENPQHEYYPKNKHSYLNTYDIVLPYTLGGRELWLDDSNSIYCDRNDDSIEDAINLVIGKSFNKYLIRNDFLSKLKMHRIQFLYLLKSVLNELGMKPIRINKFINLPYGNSTINSTEWKKLFSIYE